MEGWVGCLTGCRVAGEVAMFDGSELLDLVLLTGLAELFIELFV